MAGIVLVAWHKTNHYMFVLSDLIYHYFLARWCIKLAELLISHRVKECSEHDRAPLRPYYAT